MPKLFIYIHLFALTSWSTSHYVVTFPCQATGPWFIFLEPSKQTAPRIYTEDKTKREKSLLLRNRGKT